MAAANAESSHGIQTELWFRIPKLTPRFQTSTKLKNGVTVMTVGGFITSVRIHDLLIWSSTVISNASATPSRVISDLPIGPKCSPDGGFDMSDGIGAAHANVRIAAIAANLG